MMSFVVIIHEPCNEKTLREISSFYQAHQAVEKENFLNFSLACCFTIIRFLIFYSTLYEPPLAFYQI